MQLLDFILRKLHLTRTQSTALVHVPAVTGTWRQVKSGAIVRSYLYRCDCGQQNEYGASEALVSRTHKCVCGREFNLLRTLNALNTDGTFNVTPSELAVRLDSLAIQRVDKAAPQPPFVSVGNENFRVEWGGKQDAARERAFQTGDPDMGLF